MKQFVSSFSLEWILRIAVAGEFLGHGVFALQGKAQWIGWIEKMLSVDHVLAGQLLFAVGVSDLLIALFCALAADTPHSSFGGYLGILDRTRPAFDW